MSGTKPVRVIFLDIDGVMNCDTDWVEARLLGHPINRGTDMINRGKLALLKLIITSTDAQVVLSSTWRLHFKLDEMFNAFKIRGFDLPEEEFWHGVTSNMGGYGKRGYEVQQYLKEHPEITHYVILDDVNAFLPEQQDHFVHTDFVDGLNYNQAQRAIEILRG